MMTAFHPVRSIGAALILGLLLWTGRVEAQTTASDPAAVTPVAVAFSRQIDFVSSVNGRRYRLTIALPVPSAVVPKGGFPVLYVLDGYSMFGTAVDAARAAVKTGIVVVGVGYPLDDAAFVANATGLPLATDAATAWRNANAAVDVLRNHDLTLPATADFIARRPGFGITATNVGGADDFLATIERDVKPRIAQLVSVDVHNQVLFGHSFGGLAVVRALLTRPSSFRTFIAASPSIYWNDSAVLADETAFAALVRKGSAVPRVLITVGGDESTPPPPQPGETAADRKRTTDGLALRKTLENARALAARLAAIKGSIGYEAQGVVFPDEGHVSSQQAAISRGVRFAFVKKP